MDFHCNKKKPLIWVRHIKGFFYIPKIILIKNPIPKDIAATLKLIVVICKNLFLKGKSLATDI